MLPNNNNNMRLLEVEVDEKVPVPEGEVEVGNKINIVRDDEGVLYGQVRTDLDAPYRDINTSYFDQSTVELDLGDITESRYFNDFEFPIDSSTSTSQGAITFRYLPGRDQGFEKSFNRSDAYKIDYVPFIDDLLHMDDQRVFGQQVFQQVQEVVEEEGISQQEFLNWVSDIEPDRYSLLMDNFSRLSQSEDFFHRDVVEDQQLEKKAFVEYIVWETLHQQREKYGRKGPNQLSEEEVFAELPDYEDIAGDIPHAGESHFETGFHDIFGQNLVEYVEMKRSGAASEAVREFKDESDLDESSESSDNILQDNGISSVEGILTTKPEGITDFLTGEA